MKKITEITTEREFISKLRTYYRKGRRKGYQRNEISFLSVMEYTGHATREFEYQSEKYFSVGIRAYDWAHGNCLLSALIDKWENEIEVEKRKKQHTQAAETLQISTKTAEVTNVSTEATKAEEAPKYSISERDGNVYVTFKRGVIRQCAKRCGVSCKSAEWNTIAQAYNGTHSDMGMGLSFFFDGREDAVRFAELVCNGDISGYYKLYMDKIIAEGEARKKRIAEKCAEYDAAQAYFAECMADEDAETVNVSVEAENAAETKETPRCECPNYADYAFERGWSIENTDFDPHSGVLCMIHFDPSDEKYVCGCLWQINSDKPNYTEHRRFKTLKGAQNYGTKRMGMKLEYQTLTVNCSVTPSEPPQSLEAPRAAQSLTSTDKRPQIA